MQFASDNRAPATPEVLDALTAEAAQPGGGYGVDHTTAALDDAFAEVFEHEVCVVPVATGTAANSLALASLCRPWGAVLCHPEAHVLVDEGGAPEFYGDGLRLTPLPDAGTGRIEVAALRSFLDELATDRNDVHQVPPQALTFTNLSELGRAYDPGATAALAGAARAAGLRVHLDGARFANAVVATGASPADLTWRSGVEVVSFGGTKNGALAAEAVVAFDPTLAEELERRRKRGGHLLSKMRVVSAQLLAQLGDGRWLERARSANDAADRLARGLGGIEGIDLVVPADGNEVFVRTSAEEAARWRAAGVDCYQRLTGDRAEVRLVTAWSTSPEEVDALVALAAGRIGSRKT